MLAAETADEMMTMVKDATQAIHRYGFQWKRKALEYAAGGMLVEGFLPEVIMTDVSGLRFKSIVL